ncbi:MAG TPA: ABC transporter permease, partial [Dehalococcoidia bacterium]|nr:ABC transporter permease [Dehalococcoidia bacterium]
WSFTRKKPLGAMCGLIVIFFVLVGDLVPETINKISRTAGLSDRPVPYLADQLESQTGIIYPYAKQDLRARLQGPSGKHLLGTDSIGRDILSRLLYGARTAVMVSFGAVLISEFIGASIGIMSGYYGGAVDKFAYRIVDVFQALPGLVVLITILGIFGSGLWQLIFVIGFVGGPPGSRTIRGQTVYIMASPFIEAARVIGASDIRIMTRYVLPNVFALIVLQATLRLGFVVLLEASLSFLGYGLPPPFPSWGQMLSLEGREYMRTQPGLAIYPGLAIGLLVFSFNLFGDALRDVLDPRLRGSR